ncbi:MAG: DMT family transporter [Pseudomonadota bacterium]|nr:DMT family transporter [Pseudomonadota bacterium]
MNSLPGDRKLSSALLLILGGFLLAFQDSIVKLMSDQTTLWQFQGLRGAFNLCLLLVFLVLFRKVSFILPRNYFAVYLRAFFLTLTMICFFSGAPYLTITQMAAGLYTYPLFTVILASPVLKEKITLLKIFSLILGFTGASLILTPWESNISIFQLIPILAGFFYACNILTIRKLCINETPYAMAAGVAVTFVIICSLMLLFNELVNFSEDSRSFNPFLMNGWTTLTITLILTVLMVSLFNVSGNLFITKAYQTSESSWLAPIDYIYFIFAAFWSKILFDKLPTGLGLIGIILIVSAGILIGTQRNK